MSNDYVLRAVDAVMRKSVAALQLLSERETSSDALAVGLAERTAEAPLDAALVQETQRTLDMALEALEEIRRLDQKESKRDG